MNATPRWLIQAYNGSLRLFPVRFQEEYGDEMKIVFAEAYREAADISPRSGWMLALRELRDLPGNLIREHLANLKKGMLLAPPGPTQSLPRSALRGALVFGITFSLFYLVFCLLDILLNAGKSMYAGNSVWGVVIYIDWIPLAIGIGVAWLGMPAGKRRVWVPGLAIALGLFLFYRLLAPVFTPIYDSLIHDESIRIFMISLIVIQEALVGVIVGGALAWIQRAGKKWGWYGLAGALGFNLGWLTKALLGGAIMFQAHWMDGVVIGSPWYFAYWLAETIPHGLVIGACLGLAMGRRGEKVPAAATT